MYRNRIAIVSPAFEGGGAERVLSYLVNENLGTGYSLSNRVSYIQEPDRAQCINESNYRLIRWISKSRFLLEILKTNDVIITSDFPILLFLRLIAGLITKESMIVFRPSIDAYYLQNKLMNVVGESWSKKILNKIVNDISFIYQTNEIKASFEHLGVHSLKSIVVNNPFSGVTFSKVNTGELVNRIAFIGRGTIEKGYDRFCVLASSEKLTHYDFDHFGLNGIGLNLRSDFILEHGWTKLEELSLHRTAVIVPSRLEGFPNIILELVSNGIKPIVSKEVAEYFDHLTEIHSLLLVVDFERNDFPEKVRNLLVSEKMCLQRREVCGAKSALMSSQEYVQIVHNFIHDK